MKQGVTTVSLVNTDQFIFGTHVYCVRKKKIPLELGHKISSIHVKVLFIVFTPFRKLSHAQ